MRELCKVPWQHLGNYHEKGRGISVKPEREHVGLAEVWCHVLGPVHMRRTISRSRDVSVGRDETIHGSHEKN